MKRYVVGGVLGFALAVATGVSLPGARAEKKVDCAAAKARVAELERKSESLRNQAAEQLSFGKPQTGTAMLMKLADLRIELHEAQIAASACGVIASP